MKVGTLPLLAALGIGIAVAVGAVVAFLQMTAKDKDSGEISPQYRDSQIFFDEEASAENDAIDWSETGADREENEAEHPLADYTIPISPVVMYNGCAEPAGDDEPRLRGLEGEHAGSCYRVADRRLIFGRDPAQCSILFPNEAGEISRIHCTLKFIPDSRKFILEDNGSSNGTFLGNGERLRPGVRYELSAGEKFSLSSSAHLFEVLD